ncbi:DUF1648 domain-containing protein [Tsukamurella sp. 1534]|uniref:DUF1648 domain-containing protein n=1 Tax=Tsukamurella sp. 1534 TaxID=1151061 RepID=UPI0002D932CE|nr:DUF1648 domain-containing protein [Tsukamurella sp. 1534]
MRTRWSIFLVAVLLCAVSLAWAAASGPDPFPTHWGASGKADSWGPRGESVAFLAATSLGTAVLFGAIAAFTSRIPARMINTPNREYWLAADHRSELDTLLQSSMLWIGAGVQLLVGVSVVGAIASPQDNAATGLVTWIFPVLVLATVGYLIWKLLHPPVE